ncbi:Hsp20/alpha crystallin family protein [Piscinibacter sp. XHJ-5]|uniref:Hsp20/alpha crystallin family protein n=1 Tax=Piscinibacter sp. XHJ-5 TaxID=3037797 RepID=UPI002452FA16|nr:Hsp20/alpha crystallin family protein [Piscinibacter sp. XHJ-5]
MYESLLNFPGGLFGEFDRLRREMDDIFGVSGLPSSIRSVAHGATPAINVGRTANSVEVYAFAPGLDPAKIDVTLDRGVLRISGERASAIPENDEKVQVYSRERGTGSFMRAVSLPDDVDPGQVRASYRDGVLQVSIPRRESAQPKRITVQ